MGAFWVRAFEACIFPLAACNYSATGCRNATTPNGAHLIHRSGLLDRDLHRIHHSKQQGQVVRTTGLRNLPH